MQVKVWRWALGLTYVVAVAAIWIASSFVVQSVVDSGVSPFLITYICNSLLVIYLPIVEIGRYLEDSRFWGAKKGDSGLKALGDSEEVVLLRESNLSPRTDGSVPLVATKQKEINESLELEDLESESTLSTHDNELECNEIIGSSEDAKEHLDAKGRWTRSRMAKVGLLICPFWFLAQLTFNLSLKYTTVTSNTIISSASSLFTFLVSVIFLGERFTWVKLFSVLLCMGGTITVSLGDKASGSSAVAPNPLLGDALALVSACFYAAYISLIRKKLPDEDDEKSGQASMAQFLGFVGLFNLLIFCPVAVFLNLTKLEPFHRLSWKQFSLIISKGLFDNVLSDYLWAKAVLLTTATVATAGLTIQVPLAAIIDSLTGQAPHLLNYVGAAFVLVGFTGINVPSDACCSTRHADKKAENVAADETQNFSITRDIIITS
ncbi:hypothetical protein Syun_030658 [Stephania yunnanensis]|uniref:EamA domain-containing protein n=1 Tax=Stephania yunnanensis TaxID=152371 RepID=A0AAP0DUD9_9MAGN